MLRRHIGDTLRRVSAQMPVVALIGPRQSGKTTLARSAFPNHRYVSLERPDIRAAAMADPRAFLAGVRDGAVLDEVHRFPDLLSWLQVAVDDDARPGRFILTASQDFLLMEGVSQSLAGRVSILRLLPLSHAELLERPALDLDAIDATRPPGPPPPRGVWETVWAGLYPRIHDQGLDAERWLADYARAYVERDLREVLRVSNPDQFHLFVRLAAGRTGQELNLASLAEDVGVSPPTARSWLSALRIGSLVTLLPAHHVNFRKRLRKRPRLHFLDSGLACHLLGIRTPGMLESHPLRGAIFESYVVSEFVKAFEHQGRAPPLYHWKDATGHEIDVIVDLGDRLVPIEVKSGATLPTTAFDTLRWWRELPGNGNRTGLVVYGGEETSSRHGFGVRPWFSV